VVLEMVLVAVALLEGTVYAGASGAAFFLAAGRLVFLDGDSRWTLRVEGGMIFVLYGMI
jgi:hypothetical protein